jgi:hypothetical protein
MNFILALMVDPHSSPEKNIKESEPEIRIEYLRMWAHQSELMWSRLQAAYLVHGSMLVAWFFLRTLHFHYFLQIGALFVGVALGYCLVKITKRDSKYMHLYSKAAGDLFKHTDKPKPIGKKLIISMLWILVLTEAALIGYTIYSPVYSPIK